jgi:hypothetical protein
MESGSDTFPILVSGHKQKRFNSPQKHTAVISPLGETICGFRVRVNPRDREWARETDGSLGTRPNDRKLLAILPACSARTLDMAGELIYGSQHEPAR